MTLGAIFEAHPPPTQAKQTLMVVGHTATPIQKVVGWDQEHDSRHDSTKCKNASRHYIHRQRRIHQHNGKVATYF